VSFYSHHMAVPLNRMPMTLSLSGDYEAGKLVTNAVLAGSIILGKRKGDR
jgi:hypothetical protein